MNVYELPQHTPTRVILRPDDERVPTNFCEGLDAAASLTRGVAEYVSQLKINGAQAFVKCFDDWATIDDDDGWFPSFIAYTNENDGNYEAANLSPHVGMKRYADGTYEVSSAELAIDVKCEAWANEPYQRSILMKLLEDAFQPVDWMYGFRLELPHYYNQRATFEPLRNVRLGDAQAALQRFVIARFTLRAVVPVTRVLPFAIGKPIVRTTIVPPGTPLGVDTPK